MLNQKDGIIKKRGIHPMHGGECFVRTWRGMAVKCRFGQRQVMRKLMPGKLSNILTVALMKKRWCKNETEVF